MQDNVHRLCSLAWANERRWQANDGYEPSGCAALMEQVTNARKRYVRAAVVHRLVIAGVLGPTSSQNVHGPHAHAGASNDVMATAKAAVTRMICSGTWSMPLVTPLLDGEEGRKKGNQMRTTDEDSDHDDRDDHDGDEAKYSVQASAVMGLVEATRGPALEAAVGQPMPPRHSAQQAVGLVCASLLERIKQHVGSTARIAAHALKMPSPYVHDLQANHMDECTRIIATLFQHVGHQRTRQVALKHALWEAEASLVKVRLARWRDGGMEVRHRHVVRD